MRTARAIRYKICFLELKIFSVYVRCCALCDPSESRDPDLLFSSLLAAIFNRPIIAGTTGRPSSCSSSFPFLFFFPVQNVDAPVLSSTVPLPLPLPTSQGGRETFAFFVTDTGNSKAFLAIQILYRPLRSPSRSSNQAPPPLRRETSGSAPSPARSLPGGRPGDVVIGEGFVDLLSLFPVVDGTYTPGVLKGNSRRVAVPMREPEGKT